MAGISLMENTMSPMTKKVVCPVAFRDLAQTVSTSLRISSCSIPFRTMTILSFFWNTIPMPVSPRYSSRKLNREK